MPFDLLSMLCSVQLHTLNPKPNGGRWISEAACPPSVAAGATRRASLQRCKAAPVGDLLVLPGVCARFRRPLVTHTADFDWDRRRRVLARLVVIVCIVEHATTK